VETILLERFPPAQKPCGGAVPSGAFKEFGLPEGLINFRVASIRIFPPGSEPYEVAIEDGFIGMVDRRAFDSHLLGEAERAGASVLAGAFSRFLLREGNRIVSEAVVDGRAVEIRSDCVVAADGVNSRVRAALGFKPVGSLLTLSAKVPVKSGQCEFHFGKDLPGGYGWVFPSKDASSVGTGSTAPEGLGKGFRGFLSRIGIGENGFRARGYRIPLWEDEAMTEGRVLFCGDSAGLVMPFTFEGIYYAMRSGQMAAEAIIKERPSDYGRLWRRSFRMRFLLMKQIWSHYMQDEASMERLLNVIRNRAVQRSAVRLWVDKTYGRSSLLSFANSLRKFRLF
jgi:geranylgeranyl reductase